ncbi:protein phosphatase 2C domain-containing protein [Streptomyces sp. NBC_00986]|nr:protein phosphatase 2C domain-containing protein [Streptomyces sp. NBC_00986]
MPPRQGLHAGTQPGLRPADPQRPAGAEPPPAHPQRPAAPVSPTDNPGAAPGDLRPDGLSAPSSSAAPARPAEDPAGAAQALRSDGPSSPRPYPPSSAVPAPPVGSPGVAPGDLYPDGPSASQPSVAPVRPAEDPAGAAQALRSDGPASPRPYPPSSGVPAPPAGSPGVAPEDLRPASPRPYSQSSAVPPPPADSPVGAPRGPRPDGPSSPRAYPQSSAAPEPPADRPAAAPEDLRSDGQAAPNPTLHLQPPSTPAPPTLAPQSPRPYPQPPAEPAPFGDNLGPAPQAPRPYPHPPAALAPPPDLPALAPPPPPPTLDYVGSGPPTYDPEPTALPLADPDELDDLVADTVLDGARYGASTIRAASVRGDSARFRGEPRRDSLLTARFGVGEQALVLVAMATGARATPGAHRAAAEACDWIARAVGRSHARLSEDIRAARRGDLKSGLHRLTDRSLGKLRASAAEQGIDPEEYSAGLRCLLLPAHPECRTRVFFGVGAGGLFRLRDGEWQDIEPTVGDLTGEAVVGFGSQPAETPEGDRLTMDLGIPTPPSPYEPAPEPPREPFRFRASVARPGDTLLMCTGGLAEPLRGEPELSAHLAGRWSGTTPPGLAAFLADTQVRVKGYADDRTAAAVWEA